MNTLINPRKLSAVCVALVIVSCGGSEGDSCGDTKPRAYVVSDYQVTTVRYPGPITDQSSALLTTPVNADAEVDWSTFSIELKAEYQHYLVDQQQPIKISFFPQALACSLAPPTPSQKLTHISITSDNAYTEELPAGSELANLFASIDFPRPAIASLNGANLPAPMRLKMHLLQAPQYSRQNFTVKVTLDDGKIFIMESGNFYFGVEAEEILTQQLVLDATAEDVQVISVVHRDDAYLYGANKASQDFYYFPSQKVVLQVAIENDPAASGVEARIHIFAQHEQEVAISRWINNQHSDAIWPETTMPIKSLTLASEQARVDRISFVVSDTFGTDKLFKHYKVDYLIEDIQDTALVQLKGFSATADIYYQPIP